MGVHPQGTSDHESAGGKAELADDRFVGNTDLARWKTPAGRWLAARAQRLSTRLGPYGVLILILAAGAIVASLLAFTTGWVYEAVTEADGVAALDHPVLEAAMTMRSPALDAAATAYTDLGGGIGMPILAVIATAVLVLRRRSWTPAILIVTAAAGSLSMTIAGKQLIGRARPPLSDAVPPYEYSPSFPSGHSLNSFVIAGIIAYVIILRFHSPRARAWTVTAAALFALTIGLSRVFLGHHWLTDVLAAWTLGAAWLVVVITAHRLYLTARKTEKLNHSLGETPGG
ncbi:phosphatase PAP2 family protein [Arthrobacter sp. MI7-26]|uniref:phosphatase PAP2 family protein n=1 Tax=Arthrobacter sp. MI7-26 TaxID=2993653 RepID=UPI002249773C|nr:phosphatase PAP2 family protein [Arthrobacter sp. MI7-26]MCX2748723.1 phosphatase PAP2 family protein [Arthrobacter sp. MI7-26]